MMKLSLALISSSLLFACVADDAASTTEDSPAAGGKADEVVETSGELGSELPVLGSPRIVFEPGPELAAVQPTASLHFTYASCAARTWTLKREVQPTLEGDRVMLQLETSAFDCFGPTVVREYRIQVTSDAEAETTFVVLNPSQLTFAN